MSHHCHAKGCKTSVPPRMLMCGKHWRMVPKNLQAAVWATYRPGQEVDKRPSREWHAAADAAIAYVAAKEAPKPQPAQLRIFYHCPYGHPDCDDFPSCRKDAPVEEKTP